MCNYGISVLGPELPFNSFRNITSIIDLTTTPATPTTTPPSTTTTTPGNNNFIHRPFLE